MLGAGCVPDPLWGVRRLGVHVEHLEQNVVLLTGFDTVCGERIASLEETVRVCEPIAESQPGFLDLLEGEIVEALKQIRHNDRVAKRQIAKLTGRNTTLRVIVKRANVQVREMQKALCGLPRAKSAARYSIVSKRIKNTRVNTGRERLRDRLLAIVPDKSVHRLNDDSFEAWCGRCRFPRNVSLWLREKLYLLRAQSFDVPEVVREMVSGDVADLVIANAVNFPEVSRIDKIISKLLWNGQPFPLLEKFHAQALSAGGMPISHVRAMQTPQIAKLYVVAYQRKDWRSHWVAARQSINHTLVTHVERFVSMHPICIPSFVKMLRVS